MEINLGMVITQIVDIDFEEKSLNLNVEFIMYWTDEFIKLNPGYDNKVTSYLPLAQFNVSSLKVRLKSIDDIWSPDLYIYALKQKTQRSVSGVTLTSNEEGFVRVSYIFEVFKVVKCKN